MNQFLLIFFKNQIITFGYFIMDSIFYKHTEPERVSSNLITLLQLFVNDTWNKHNILLFKYNRNR